MFVLKKRDTYSWPVRFRLASSDGVFEEHEFNAEFKRLPQNRLDDIFRKKDQPVDDNVFVREILVGWSEVTDEKGKALAYNETNINALLSVPGLRPAIIGAFFSSVTGLQEKN